jgi:hypothetical protein
VPFLQSYIKYLRDAVIPRGLRENKFQMGRSAPEYLVEAANQAAELHKEAQRLAVRWLSYLACGPSFSELDSACGNPAGRPPRVVLCRREGGPVSCALGC